MSVEFRADSAELHNHLLKTQALMFEATVGATPALSFTEIPMTVAVQDAAAGQFTLLIDELVSKVYKVEVLTDVTVAAASGAPDSEGKLLLTIDLTHDLATAKAMKVIVHYKQL